MYPNNNYMYPYGQSFRQSYNVPSVMNKQSAMAYDMPANSSVLLLEEQSDHVFFVQTDSAGVKQITTYQLVPYKEPDPVNINDLDARMAKMEAMQAQLLQMLGGNVNGQSNPATDTK